jgi:hypothetical protein
LAATTGRLGNVRDRVTERVVAEARVVTAGSAGGDQVVAMDVDRAVAAPAAHVEGRPTNGISARYATATEPAAADATATQPAAANAAVT